MKQPRRRRAPSPASAKRRQQRREVEPALRERQPPGGTGGARPAPPAPSPPGPRSADSVRTPEQAPRRRRTAGRGSSSGERAPRSSALGEPAGVGMPRTAAPPRRRGRAACSTATPIRHGSRAARSPPGSASGSRWPARSPCRAPSTTMQFAAPGAAVVAEPVPVEREAEHRAGQAVLGRDRRDVGGVMLHADHRRPRSRRSAGRKEIGMQVAGDGIGPNVEDATQMPDRLVARTGASRGCRDRRYAAETKASRPRVTVTVFLRSPPSASTLGPSSPRSIGSGTKPRARRRKAGAPSIDLHHAIVGRARRSARSCVTIEVGDRRRAASARPRRRRPAARRPGWRWSRPARSLRRLAPGGPSGARRAHAAAANAAAYRRA